MCFRLHATLLALGLLVMGFAGCAPPQSQHGVWDPGAGWTPLHFAARRGDVAEVRRLIASGMNPNARNASENPPLFYAVDRDTAEVLIEGGALVNAKGLDDFTALHRAADEGRVAVVSLLLAKGADVNAHRKQGGTALHEAVRLELEDTEYSAEHYQIAQLLLARGADPFAKNEYGETVVQVAARAGDAKILALLRGSAAQHRLHPTPPRAGSSAGDR